MVLEIRLSDDSQFPFCVHKSMAKEPNAVYTNIYLKGDTER